MGSKLVLGVSQHVVITRLCVTYHLVKGCMLLATLTLPQKGGSKLLTTSLEAVLDGTDMKHGEAADTIRCHMLELSEVMVQFRN